MLMLGPFVMQLKNESVYCDKESHPMFKADGVVKHVGRVDCAVTSDHMYPSARSRYTAGLNFSTLTWSWFTLPSMWSLFSRMRLYMDPLRVSPLTTVLQYVLQVPILLWLLQCRAFPSKKVRWMYLHLSCSRKTFLRPVDMIGMK